MVWFMGHHVGVPTSSPIIAPTVPKSPLASEAEPVLVEKVLGELRDLLAELGPVVVACSGGIDSLLLATVAHDRDPAQTVIAHTVTPAVPAEDTARVLHHAREAGWHLELVRSREFDDERYLSNPADRCYYCKSNLFDALDEIRESQPAYGGAVVVTGANTDDLGEYRPGLVAAQEHDVRHPYVEAGIDKATIRALARHLGLAEAELASSPCLASRLYTGTRVTEERLRAIEVGEAILLSVGLTVARCRIREDSVLVEVPDGDRTAVTDAVLADVAVAMRAVAPQIADVSLDPRPYRPGRAFLVHGQQR